MLIGEQKNEWQREKKEVGKERKNEGRQKERRQEIGELMKECDVQWMNEEQPVLQLSLLLLYFS